MKNSKILAVILLLTGLLSVVVGIGMLFFPAEFHANASIVLNGDINLTSELRAAGGPLLVGGVIVVLGGFVDRLKFTATLLASVLFLSIGAGRIVGIVMDGWPSSALLQVTTLEIFVGLNALAAFFHFQESG